MTRSLCSYVLVLVLVVFNLSCFYKSKTFKGHFIYEKTCTCQQNILRLKEKNAVRAVFTSFQSQLYFKNKPAANNDESLHTDVTEPVPVHKVMCLSMRRDRNEFNFKVKISVKVPKY